MEGIRHRSVYDIGTLIITEITIPSSRVEYPRAVFHQQIMCMSNRSSRTHQAWKLRERKGKGRDGTIAEQGEREADEQKIIFDHPGSMFIGEVESLGRRFRVRALRVLHAVSLCERV